VPEFARAGRILGDGGRFLLLTVEASLNEKFSPFGFGRLLPFLTNVSSPQASLVGFFFNLAALVAL